MSPLPLVEAISRELVHRDKRPLERKARDVIAAMFDFQAKEIRQRFIPRIDFLFMEASVPPAVMHIADTILSGGGSKFEQDLAALLLAAVQKGAYRVGTEVKVAAQFTIPATVEAEIVRRTGAELIAGVNQTTREIVRQIIADGLDQHLSYQQVATQLRKRFMEFTGVATQGHLRDRATLIAVTEIGNAYSAGQLQQGREMAANGIDVEKAWLTVGEACPICDANEGEGWVPIDENFASGDEAPTAHPACRCALQMRAAKGE